ncbi:MAG: metal ABC transporter permease [Planctomycetota bacterium]|nr:metal ABC transporter permease [Planctomycetota bacterium]
MISGHSLSNADFFLPSVDQCIRVLTLADYNTRVVVLGVMALGASAGLIGTFLLLRKRALTADALSHSTLPGIAISFMIMVLLGGSGKSLIGLLAGAFVFGGIGVLCILAIRQTTRLKDDAAIGIVLSVFFGLGLCLLRMASELPTGSVSGLGDFIFGKAASMIASDAFLMAGVAVLALIATFVMRKELTLLCFDEQFTSVQGWSVLWLDILLMALVAIVTVVALQSVGLVLAVALLIIPAASAKYWTRRIWTMLIAAAVIGCLSGWLGAVVSALVPRMPTGPIIVLLCGFWFVISFIFGSNDGLALRQFARWSLNRRIARQHILRAIWEVCEKRQAQAVSVEELASLRSWNVATVRRLLRKITRGGLAVRLSHHSWRVTEKGRIESSRVARNHRLWEIYLINYADIAPTHVDRDADMIEHILGIEMVEKLDQLLELGHTPKSPHPIGPIL